MHGPVNKTRSISTPTETELYYMVAHRDAGGKWLCNHITTDRAEAMDRQRQNRKFLSSGDDFLIVRIRLPV
ncbi:MAG: hypothetical protein KDC70_00150 [Saprospiraceae bacterium]|nr:hypothetical protein [Saprospiraceae bacterium]